MGKRKPKTKRPATQRAEPTQEAMARGDFISAGLAYRRVPVIETMFKRGQLTAIEYQQLGYYRDQASIADKSGCKSCLDRSINPGGNGPGVAVVSALIETGRIERDLGSVQMIARSVAVDDLSLTEWCIAMNGGRERYDKRGRFVALVPVNEKMAIGRALMELKMAAGRIVR